MKYDKWNIKGYDRAEAGKLYTNGTNALLSLLLASRGITTEQAYLEMTDNRISSLPDPYILTDMAKAVDRIRTAIDNSETIGVFGDYDVDGITATCLLTQYLRSKGVSCHDYIPERTEDGYGLQQNGIEVLRKKGATLIVSVDCGITAYAACDYAKRVGTDIIITDHHECGERMPDAYAIINPKKPGETYPNRNLAGCGVAFKLACAIEGVEKTEEMVCTYCDFVAAGTISDVMPLLGENRILVRQGLYVMRRGGHIGFEMLGKASGVDMRTIGTSGISFALAPRLNAAGRMGRTGVARDLLMTTDATDASECGHMLCDLNFQRRQVEKEMLDDAETQLAAYPETGPIILAGEGWNQGVAGIAASRIMEKHFRPTAIICLMDDIGKGSARSTDGFDIFEAVSSCRDILISFGGHQHAVGFSLSTDNVDKFRDRVRAYYDEHFDPATCLKTLNVDFEVKHPEILTIDNVESLKLLEPYGNGNPSSKMCILDAEVDMITSLGGGKHVKLWITKNGQSKECLFFNTSAEQTGVSVGDRINIAFEPKINEFRGRKSVQLLLADIQKNQ